jgi:hypothetical protein
MPDQIEAHATHYFKNNDKRCAQLFEKEFEASVVANRNCKVGASYLKEFQESMVEYVYIKHINKATVCIPKCNQPSTTKSESRHKQAFKKAMESQGPINEHKRARAQ